MIRNLTAKTPFFLAILSIIFSVFLAAREISSRPSNYLGKNITRIDIQGNENTPTSEIYSLIKMRPGMVLTRDLLNEDLKALFAKETIAYARIEGSSYKNGVAVTFIIEEQPVVASVLIRGTKELNVGELEDLIPVKKNSIYSKQLVTRSRELILFQCQEKGLFNAMVRVDVTPEEGRKNAIDVVFTVDEGEDIRIAKINFVGVHVLDVDQLYEAIDHQEKDLFLDGEFQLSKVDYDKE